ncbi:ankyrin repeat domain-containing protein 45 [Pelodytes ibericus]
MEDPVPPVNPVLRCALEGNMQALQLLFENTADAPDEQASQLLLEEDLLGRNPLFLACIVGHGEMVKELVKYGANVNQQTTRGYLPLHCAAAWGQLEVLKKLVELGTDILAVNFQGEKACDIAARYNMTECADFLQWAEAKESLKICIMHTQQCTVDSEKVQGKLLKEQKMQINTACKSKNEWLKHTTNPTTQDFLEQKQQLETTLQAILTKVNTPRAESMKTRKN